MKLTKNRRLKTSDKVYASWAKQLNETASTYSLANGGDLVGAVANAGFSPSGFMVGLNVKF